MKGMKSTFYGAAFCGFIYFALYKYLKSFFKEKLGEDTDPAYSYILASIVTGLVNFIVGYPIDVIKCRFQSANHIYKYQNILHAFMREIKDNRGRSLFAGVGPSLWSSLSYVALQYTIYEKTMTFFRQRMDKETFR